MVTISPCQKNTKTTGSSHEIGFSAERGEKLSIIAWLYLNSDKCSGQKDIILHTDLRITDEGKSPSIADAHNILIEPSNEYSIIPRTNFGIEELTKKYPSENFAIDKDFNTKDLLVGEVKSPLYTIAKKVDRRFCLGEVEEGKDGKAMETRLTKVGEKPTQCSL
jgi:hypothetical protein